MQFLWMAFILTTLVHGMEFTSLDEIPSLGDRTNEIELSGLDNQNTIQFNDANQMFTDDLDGDSQKKCSMNTSSLCNTDVNLNSNLLCNKGENHKEPFEDFSEYLFVVILNFLDLKELSEKFLLNKYLFERTERAYRNAIQLGPRTGIFTADNVLLIAVLNRRFQRTFILCMKNSPESCYPLYKHVFIQSNTKVIRCTTY
jgi:hypothetical protein